MSYTNLIKALTKLDTEQIELNLSEENSEVSENTLESYITAKTSGFTKIGYGGYLEKRLFYMRSRLFDGKQPRKIHLGLDIWYKEFQNIFAPIDGVVHSFANNTNDGDYGPTIVLKHNIGSSSIYTLYGHLSIGCLKGIKMGKIIKAGDCIGCMGTKEDNGNWPAHLHFQVINDMKYYMGDFPGVCTQEEIDYWKTLSPDPNLIEAHL